ncbi:MAG TPA: transcription termination/antitermination protein NusG [Planctomycetota bacterium]|nr:transcription termination/antitermination protein NusG [Planctomycetota bacterium]
MKRWFALRCMSEREERIKQALERRIRAGGPKVEELITRVLVPTEQLSKVKAGSKSLVENKMYPGYIFAEIELEEDGSIPDPAWYAVMETTGISGFVGGTKNQPAPMEPQEVERILNNIERSKKDPKPALQYKVGDKVRIKEGTFENYDGVIVEINEASGRLKVNVTIFGRQTTVDLDNGVIEAL